MERGSRLKRNAYMNPAPILEFTTPTTIMKHDTSNLYRNPMYLYTQSQNSYVVMVQHR